MKISKISYSNFKGNLYRYIMYALSNSLAVSVFFIFLNFTQHPSLQKSQLQGHGVAIEGTVMGLNLALTIIVIFSFFFIVYSSTTFIKSRGKEFGLLSLYGMTNRQIRSLVRKENTLLSLFSIGQGLIIGLIFSKLFFMIMEYLTDVSLVFMISKKALLISIGVFFLLFEIINNISLFTIKNQEIIEQVKTDRTPKELPEFSKLKALIGVLLLILGYALAWVVEGAMVVLGMIPITLIVIAGTYFLFTQFSIFLANKIKGSKFVIYNKTNLIAYSQLIFKLKDTARVMFLAAILIAVSFTATETIYSFYSDSDSILGYNNYEDIGIAYRSWEGGQGEYEEANKFIASNRDKLEESYELELMLGKDLSLDSNIDTDRDILVMSESQYNYVRKLDGKDPISLGVNEASYHHVDSEYNGYKDLGEKLPIKTIKLQVGENNESFDKAFEIYDSLISIPSIGFREMYVIADERYERIKPNLDKESLAQYSLYKFKNSKESYKIGKELLSKYEGKLGIYVQEYYRRNIKKIYGTILFIGFFVALLFFIASGSVIYFKLFNEIESDRLEYGILRNIGMSTKDIKRIVSKQLRILFFLPFLVGSIHSLFALKSLSNLVGMNLIKNGLVVSLGYFVFQVCFFIFIRSIYIKKLRVK